MGYDIENLEQHSVSSKTKYLLDSNIWIKILAPKNKPSKKDKKYINFFEKLLETKGQNIILPALVISEVMNRLIRDVHMNKFIQKKGIPTPVPNDFYKNHFRPSPEYRIAYTLIADEFRNYLNKIEFTNDGFGNTIKFKHVLSHLDYNLDFNDFYYYNLAKKRKYTIVTDDKDFWVKGVKVITLSSTLLNMYNGLSK